MTHDFEKALDVISMFQDNDIKQTIQLALRIADKLQKCEISLAMLRDGQEEVFERKIFGKMSSRLIKECEDEQRRMDE